MVATIMIAHANAFTTPFRHSLRKSTCVAFGDEFIHRPRPAPGQPRRWNVD